MSSKIKGITIELEGKSTGLDKVLKDVEKSARNTNKELRSVNSSLKFNPGNAELVAQQQELLANQIDNTSQKLKQLRDAQAEVDRQFQSGDINAEQYRAFQRELVETESKLNHYQTALKNSQQEQEDLARNTQRLETYFEATGTSVDDFSDVIGTKLTNAIRDGRANSQQLETALNQIGRTALGSEADISKLKNELDSIDDGSSIEDVRNGLQRLETSANEAGDALENMGDKLDAGNLMDAADQLGGVTDKIIDIGTAAIESSGEIDNAVVKYNAAFGLVGDEAESTAEKINNLYKSGIVDSYEEAGDILVQTGTQLKDLDDIELQKVSRNVAIFAKRFDADIPESLRGVNALMTTFGVSADEALNMMTVGTQRGLDKTDELGDNLAEYATLFEESGYSAEEMFAILEAGLDGGAYNLDKVNDLVKEFGVRLNDGSIATAVENLGGGFEEVYQEIEDGNLTAKEAFQLLGEEIMSLGSEQEKAAAISEIFGSMGEDAGTKVIEAMLGASGAVNGVESAYQNADEAAQIFSQRTQQEKFSSNLRKLEEALLPLGEALLELANDILPIVIGFIEDLITQFNELSPAGKSFAEFILLLSGIGAVVAPIAVAVMGLVGAFSALNIAMLPLTAAILGISAVIAGVIIAMQNWDEIMAWLSEAISTAVTEWGTMFSNVGVVIATFVQIGIAWISNLGMSVISWFSSMWTTVSESASGMWSSVSTAFSNIWTSVTTSVSGAYSSVQTWFSNMVTAVSGRLNSILAKVKEIWTSVVNAIRDKVSSAKSAADSVMSGVYDTITGWWNNFKDAGSNIVSMIADGISAGVGKVKSAIGNVTQTIRNYLPFSPAKEGALRDIHRLNFGGTIADSIDRDANRPVRAIGNLTQGMMKALNDIPSNFEFGLGANISNLMKSMNRTSKQFVESSNSGQSNETALNIGTIDNSQMINLLAMIAEMLESIQNKPSDTYLDGMNLTKGLHPYQKQYETVLTTRKNRMKGDY